MLVPRCSSLSRCPLAPVQKIRTTHLTLAPFSARAPASRRKRGSGSFLFEEEEERCREGRKKNLVVILCGSTAVTKSRTGVHTQKSLECPDVWSALPQTMYTKIRGHLGGHPLWEHHGYHVHKKLFSGHPLWEHRGH